MGKLINTQKLHNTLLNNQGIKEETKGEIQKFLGTNATLDGFRRTGDLERQIHFAGHFIEQLFKL